MALICDTGPLYAAMDHNDADHRRCALLLSESPERLVVPLPVLVELEWLASRRLGSGPFDRFLADVEGGALVVMDLRPIDYARTRILMRQYADFPLCFVDAAVLALVERFDEPKVATLDHRHFATVRPTHVSSLTLVPDLE